MHVPLNPQTHHLLNNESISKTKPGVIILNTGRGALIDTKALILALKSGQVGGAGLDVYEEEESIFFNDLSDQILQDDVLARLLTFPNTIITSNLTPRSISNNFFITSWWVQKVLISVYMLVTLQLLLFGI